jgi:hypothetical protein
MFVPLLTTVLICALNYHELVVTAESLKSHHIIDNIVNLKKKNNNKQTKLSNWVHLGFLSHFPYSYVI